MFLSPTGCLVSRNKLDLAHNVVIEVSELLCRNPVLKRRGGTDLLNLEFRQIIGPHREAQHISNETGGCVSRVPIASDKGCVLFVKHGIEDRLPFQTRGEGLETSVCDQVKLLLADGPEQCRCRVWHSRIVAASVAMLANSLENGVTGNYEELCSGHLPVSCVFAEVTNENETETTVGRG
jgi:hypothetical protein